MKQYAQGLDQLRRNVMDIKLCFPSKESTYLSKYTRSIGNNCDMPHN